VVSKGARGGVTTADVTVVDGDTRVAELARMLGGDPESAVSRAHAQELLASAAAVGSTDATDHSASSSAASRAPAKRARRR
jgi:DNA repair protein RecN (Recombination protein N)